MINMMYKLFNIEQICGEQVGNISSSDIQNDPNFIFENDPTFETLVLYSSDGTIINVNSWIECANYVQGGWSNSLILSSNYHIYYFYAALLTSGLLITYELFKSKYVKK
tara:strand:+ start:319 stop:645 length:327 start_codon:yes stop_codon:yes gene_type:complete